MSLSNYYPELAAVEAIKTLLLADTGITDQIKNTRTNTSEIYGIPLSQMTAPFFPAVAVFPVGVTYSQINSIETGILQVEIDVLAQSANKDTSITNVFKLARDLKFVLEQRRDLLGTAVIFNTERIVITDIKGSNSLWTALATVTLTVRLAVHYFNPGASYNG